MNIMIKLLGKDGREEKRVELERKEERRSRGNEIEWELWVQEKNEKEEEEEEKIKDEEQMRKCQLRGK